MEEKKSWQEWKTTILGVITLILGILVSFGVITPEQSSELGIHLGSLGEVISGAIMAVSGLINVFRAK
jgi:fumarate reductase subunit D